MSNSPIIAVMNDWGTVSDIFEELGAITLDVEHTSEVGRAVRAADLVVFTGGGDIDPARYGYEERHRRVYGVSSQRDDVEFAAFHFARKMRVPVLGICRGHQLINVGWGGTLHQDIFDGAGELHRHDGGDHAVKLRPGTRIGQALGRSLLRSVTSLHHQAVDRLGDGLVPVGWDTDGTVEMIETAPGVRPYMLGTQFHPEMDAKFTTKANGYNPWRLFKFMYGLARQHNMSVGNWDERFALVDDLLFNYKAKYRSLSTPSTTRIVSGGVTVSSYGTPSTDSLMRYQEEVAASVAHDLDPEDEEDSYEAWAQRSAFFSRRSVSLSQIDAMCAGEHGCVCPLDCADYGSCAVEDTAAQTLGLERSVVTQVVNEALSDPVQDGKRGSKR